MFTVLDKLKRRAGSVPPELLVVLLLVAILGVLNALEFHQRAYLNLYFLPVVLASYSLGRAGGVSTAVAAISLVAWMALLDPQAFSYGDHPYQRWADLTLWSCFLVLTAAAMGHLYDLRNRAIGDLRRASRGIVNILADFLRTADEYTEAHSIRVARLAVTIGRRMGLSSDELDDLRIAGILHDIGKLDVSSEVLRKATRLTRAEWEEIREHPANGARLVQRLGSLWEGAVPMILHHHERYGGDGYHSLAGDEIPLGARIIAVADAYDALTSDRPYRQAKKPSEAVAVIRRGAGTQFDPAVVAAFEALVLEPSRRQVARAVGAEGLGSSARGTLRDVLDRTIVERDPR